MKKSLVTAIALVAAAGAVHAQSVEFRIVERRGQTSWTPATTLAPLNDGVLDLAVQARVVGGTAGRGIGNFNFNVTTTSGEAESRGSLARARISNTGTGTYNTSATQYDLSSTLGQGGLAATYIYLAGINGAFNGVINSSSGTYTNNAAEQDIGLITGAPIGGSLLTTFGSAGVVDANGDPVPDTYPGTGTTATLDNALANTYLGANGNFVDLYHFRYTITNSTIDRTIVFAITGAAAQTFGSLASSSGVWGPAGITDATVSVGSPLSFRVIVPAPASAALLGLGGLMAARRRRTA